MHILITDSGVGGLSVVAYGAWVFGSEQSFEAGTYPRLLEARGIDASRIVSQACPGLADTISEDRQGTNAAAEIRKWVTAATAKMNGRDVPVVACLACTHYG